MISNCETTFWPLVAVTTSYWHYSSDHPQQYSSLIILMLNIAARNTRQLLHRLHCGAADYKQVFDGVLHFEDKGALGEDLFQMKSQALEFARQKLAPFSLEWEKHKHFPVDVMKEAAEMGYAAVYHQMGTGLSRLEASVIFEALSTGDVPVTTYLTIHNMCLWILEEFGSEEQKKKYGPAMVSLDMFSSYCLTEPDSGSDAKAMKTTAKKDGDEYVLNGSKMFISGGEFSDIYFVMAKTSQTEISVFIVEKGAKGLSFGKMEDKMGWKIQPTCLVNFEDVRIPARNLVGKEGIGFKIAMKALDGGRVNIASCSLGGASFCLEAAKIYMHNRKQFGKKLTEMQYLQFKFSDMATDLVSSRLLVRRAASMIDSDDSNKTLYCAMAKQSATDKCQEIVDYALQMHGGYGYLTDTGIEKYVRDLRVHKILEGTNEIMRMIISRKLLAE